jgi:nucleoside-diphosphate-sugar epimerase
MGRCRILITGRSGFIANSICNAAFFENYEFISVGRIEKLNWENIDNCAVNAEVYIHTAGIAHDTTSTIQNQTYIDVNVGLTRKLFEIFLRDAKSEKFIYFSSIKAINSTGDPEKPLTEDIQNSPSDIYGISKKMAEDWLLAQDLPQNKKVIILRPAMIYGQNPKSNLNLLIQYLFKGFPLLLNRELGSRAFLSLNNLFFVLYEIVENSYLDSGIYHLCDDGRITTLEIVRMTEDISQKKFRVILVPKIIYTFIIRILTQLGLRRISNSLEKMNSGFIVSNDKLKLALGITKFPFIIHDEMKKTIEEIAKK